MGVSWNISGLRRDGQSLDTATEVRTRKFLHQKARYRTQSRPQNQPKNRNSLPPKKAASTPPRK